MGIVVCYDFEETDSQLEGFAQDFEQVCFKCPNKPGLQLAMTRWPSDLKYDSVALKSVVWTGRWASRDQSEPLVGPIALMGFAQDFKQVCLVAATWRPSIFFLV
jgi:hypothetical protein